MKNIEDYNEIVEDFLDACISSGKVIYTDEKIKLSHDLVIEIENILIHFNDKKARNKIRKLIKI